MNIYNEISQQRSILHVPVKLTSLSRWGVLVKSRCKKRGLKEHRFRAIRRFSEYNKSILCGEGGGENYGHTRVL